MPSCIVFIVASGKPNCPVYGIKDYVTWLDLTTFVVLFGIYMASGWYGVSLCHTGSLRDKKTTTTINLLRTRGRRLLLWRHEMKTTRTAIGSVWMSWQKPGQVLVETVTTVNHCGGLIKQSKITVIYPPVEERWTLGDRDGWLSVWFQPLQWYSSWVIRFKPDTILDPFCIFAAAGYFCSLWLTLMLAFCVFSFVVVVVQVKSSHRLFISNTKNLLVVVLCV